MRSPRSIQAGVISRLKVMADINIAERRVPQDGRISMKVGGRGIDLRVATLPTVYGEKVVMRILDKGQAVLRLEELGFLPETEARFESSYRKPYGTILVTGPTGSGKSTTLYATLNTAEHSPTATSSRSRTRSSTGCPASTRCRSTRRPGSRSRRRCDRSCVPTPTSCSSVRSATGRPRSSRSRPRSPVTSCSRRCTPTTPRRRRCGSSRWASSRSSSRARSTAWSRSGSPASSATSARSRTSRPKPSSSASGWPMEDLERANGRRCTAPSAAPSCGRTGYQGRFALHEVMLVTEEIERLIIERRSTEDIQKIAVMQGMITLRDDGLRKAAHGPHLPRRDLPRRRVTRAPARPCRSQPKVQAAGRCAADNPWTHRAAIGGSVSMLVNQARRFGEALVDRHVLSRDSLESRDRRGRAHEPAAARGAAPARTRRRKDLTAALADQLGVPFIDFLETPIHQDAPDAAHRRPGAQVDGAAGRLRGPQARRRVRRARRRRSARRGRRRDDLRDHPGGRRPRRARSARST